MNELTAFVLAGGRSSRMGSDKAMLPYAGATLLEHALAVVGEITGRVFICGSRERYQVFGTVLEDIYPGCGPLGGIQVALSTSQTERNLVLSVDTPRMSPSFLAWLIGQSERGPQAITVPEAFGRRQPLCAIYDRQVATLAEQALKRGDYKVDRLFFLAPTRIVTENEIREAGFTAELFSNINTPQEYEALQEEGHRMRTPSE